MKFYVILILLFASVLLFEEGSAEADASSTKATTKIKPAPGAGPAGPAAPSSSKAPGAASVKQATVPSVTANAAGTGGSTTGKGNHAASMHGNLVMITAIGAMVAILKTL